MDEIDNNYSNDGMLIDSAMIPPVEMEVVMTGDGNVQQEYNPTSPNYQYEYTYEEQEQEIPAYENEKLLPVAIAERRDWKYDQRLKMDLYEVLDALPSEVHHKYIRLFAKRGVELEVRKDTANSHYLFPQPQPTKSAQKSFFYTQEYPEDSYANPKPYVDHQFDKSRQDQESRLCGGCNMVLRRSVYYHHARMIRERGACNLFTPQRFPCPMCIQKLGTLEKLCLHMEQLHGAPTQIKTIIFDTEEEFVQFRTELEGKGGNFRMARGNKKNKKGVVQYFRCNRLQTLSKNNTFRLVDNPSEQDLPSNRRTGKLNERPSVAKKIIRTENSCTAFYNKAYLDNGTIEIRYCDHHLHEDEKLRLPQPVRERIIQLARKHLPHIVILMIIKDERYSYCERDSANDRRIQEMKTQDIRQILAGFTRHEKQRQKNDELNIDQMLDMEKCDGSKDERREWIEARSMNPKVNRSQLSPLECKYLDLFNRAREDIMGKINERMKQENEKRTAFESFVHRSACSQNMFKSLDFTGFIPREDQYERLEKASEYLTTIINMLSHAKKEPRGQYMETSYLDMMAEKCRDIGMDPSTSSYALLQQGGDPSNPTMDEIDVVGGIDDEEAMIDPTYGRMSVGEVIKKGMCLAQAYQQASSSDDHDIPNIIEVEDEDSSAYIAAEEAVPRNSEVVGEELSAEPKMEQTEKMGPAEEEEGMVEVDEVPGIVDEVVEKNSQSQKAGDESGPSEQPQKTRTGRIVKKKEIFE